MVHDAGGMAWPSGGWGHRSVMARECHTVKVCVLVVAVAVQQGCIVESTGLYTVLFIQLVPTVFVYLFVCAVLLSFASVKACLCATRPHVVCVPHCFY